MRAVTLRKYQQKDFRAINAAHTRLRSIVYVLPTAGGKTVVAARVIRKWLNEKKRVLVLVHRRELITQMKAQLIADGLNEKHIGIIVAGEKENEAGRVQVASVQTLVNRELPEADLIVIDEAHHATASTYARILAAYGPKTKILGLTATPHRLNGAPLSDLFEEIVLGETPTKLVEAGWISRPRIFTKADGKLPDLRGVRVVGGDYNQKQLAARVNRKELVGDIVQHYITRAGGRRAIVFAASVKHAQHIAKEFRKAGIKCEAVHGDTPLAKRAEILGRNGAFERGELQVIATCMLVSEGWDLPAAKCAILARPTRSTVLYMQQVGRILRPFKETHGIAKGIEIPPVILDHAGNVLAHGMPHHDREWSLKQRLRAGGGVVPVKSCPECGSIIAAGLSVCEECGHEFAISREPDHRTDEELVELERVTKEECAKITARVRELAKAKNAPAGWVEKVVGAILGRAA